MHFSGKEKVNNVGKPESVSAFPPLFVARFVGYRPRIYPTYRPAHDESW
jgi:hypothetical protein